MIHVIEAEYLENYIIKVWFDDGSVKIVDLEPYAKRGGIFSRLADKEFFKKYFIDLNTLCWPNGADIAPERLYEIGKVTDNPQHFVPVNR
ncbi:MAG: DUF2442 domain-containing protein [Nitrospirae bacterium]|nr:DUF2442 domain-containing protein [Nitrospirota bacterium]